MDNYTQLINRMTNNILSQIRKAIENESKYDKTFIATVISKDSSGNATVFLNGRNYSAKYGRMSVSAGDTAYVCAPQNNWNELFIVNVISRKG